MEHRSLREFKQQVNRCEQIKLTKVKRPPPPIPSREGPRRKVPRPPPQRYEPPTQPPRSPPSHIGLAFEYPQWRHYLVVPSPQTAREFNNVGLPTADNAPKIPHRIINCDLNRRRMPNTGVDFNPVIKELKKLQARAINKVDTKHSKPKKHVRFQTDDKLQTFIPHREFNCEKYRIVFPEEFIAQCSPESTTGNSEKKVMPLIKKRIKNFFKIDDHEPISTKISQVWSKLKSERSSYGKI